MYTRTLNDVTASVPEIVEAVRALPGARADPRRRGDRASDPAAAPQPFQITMRRFGRKLDVARAARRAAAGGVLLRLPALATARCSSIGPRTSASPRSTSALPSALVVPRLVTERRRCRRRPSTHEALARGHEGVMAKAIDAPYEAGRRGAELAQGQARAHARPGRARGGMGAMAAGSGWLSNLHLGARDPADGGFVMLGKTFKGMTDELLDWQTRELLAREMARDDYTVYVRPELVSRSRSTTCRRARTIPAGSRCASRASRATASTSAPTKPTRSTPCARCTPSRWCRPRA